jgi:hypothetical protein
MTGMLSEWDRAVLAQAYGLGQRQVSEDATLVRTSRGPLDELFSELRRRHGWSAGEAYGYLRTMHRSLRGQLPS